MKTVSWFVKLTVIALFPEFTAHQHRKQKKKKSYFLKPGFEDLSFGRAIYRDVPVARGPSPPPLGPRVGFPADWQPLRPCTEHCCSLTLLERSQLVEEGVCVESSLLPQACCPHLPPSTRPMTGLPQFPAWLEHQSPRSLSASPAPGAPQEQCWISLRNTEQPRGPACSMVSGRADLKWAGRLYSCPEGQVPTPGNHHPNWPLSWQSELRGREGKRRR